MRFSVLSVAVVTCALSLPVPVSLTAQDEWLARDKALHFGASALIATGAYGVAAIAVPCRPARLAIGSGVALAAGIGKELHDRSSGGVASWKDLAWDVVGTTVGVTIAALVDGRDDCPVSDPSGNPAPVGSASPATWPAIRSAPDTPSVRPPGARRPRTTEPPAIPYRWVRFDPVADRPLTFRRVPPGVGAAPGTLSRGSNTSREW